MPFSNIEGLTDKQKTEIIKYHDEILFKLKNDHDILLVEKQKTDEIRKAEDAKIKADKKKVDFDSMKNATSLDEMKKLLAERDERANDLEQRILDGEKKRVETEHKRAIDVFVDKFVNENVVPDSLVQDAIRIKISTRLGIRDNNIVEVNGSELTGRTGDQLLDEIKVDKGYSNHLIANKAKGGGSAGGAGFNKFIVDKTMSREQFESSPPSEIAQFVRDGGNFVD